MNWASTTALAMAVRTGMRGERGGSARQCCAVALQTLATDLPHQSNAARRGARQGIGNRHARFGQGIGKGGQRQDYYRHGRGEEELLSRNVICE